MDESRAPDLTARTAIVHLVDTVATTATRPTDFQRWAAFLAPELDHLTHYREFLRRRIHDWTVYLTIASGHVPRTAELAGTTDWMQRTLATTSTSPAVLTILAGTANTRKTRNIARNRMNSRAVRDAHRGRRGGVRAGSWPGTAWARGRSARGRRR